MIKELINVIKVFRPRHLLKALLHPTEEVQAFKYHYGRVTAKEFVSFLARLTNEESDKLETIFKELENNHYFHDRLAEKLKMRKDGYGGQMTKEASALYALVRLLRPRVMVETGVADGVTSSYILQALHDNGEGKLYSIDIPCHMLPPGKAPGWIVEDSLRERWELRIGKSEELLRPLLDELGSMDCFMHDSLHTYDHMSFEFKTAWPYLKPGGLFLSHDIGENSSFFHFAREKGIKWREWRAFHVLGGFRKPYKNEQRKRCD